MDPLSDVLSLLKLGNYYYGGLDMGAPWSFQFPRYAGVKCYAIVSGQCWLDVDDVEEPVLLSPGDCFLLPTGRPFRLTSDLSMNSIDVITLFQSKLNGGIRSYNGGGDCFGVGGHFSLDGDHAAMLLGMLPPIVHIQKESEKKALRWSMDRLMDELRDPQPGGYLVAQNLAYMLLVQALRVHLAEGSKGSVGWLFALADKQIGTAINLMHEEPGYRWTLEVLAKRVGMSRSTFALKFKETVGTAPMEYLTNWRMRLAGDKLSKSRDSIAQIALSLGYESESAFSTAFKRVVGCSPRQYGRERSTNSVRRAETKNEEKGRIPISISS